MTRLSVNPFCCHHLQLRLAILVLKGPSLQLKFNLLAVISHQASGRLSFFHSTTVTTLAVLCCILYDCVWLCYLSLWYPYELYTMWLIDGWHDDWNKWLVACAHAMCTCHHLHMLRLPFTHIFHCPSHPPRSSSHLCYPVHLHSGSRKRILYMAPRLQVHTTTFSFRVTRSSPNACWWTAFDVNIMDVIHLVFFLVHFTAWITRNTLAFGISAPPPKSPILSIPCFSWIPVLTDHSTVSSCHGSIQDKAAPWAITSSCTCSCGMT